MDDEEYKAEYAKAAAELEAKANGTAAPEPAPRADDGTFAKASPVVPDVPPTPDPAPVPDEPKAAEPDPLAEFRTKLEKAEKALKDTQAWGTRNAQELAQLRRDAEERRRQAERPAILDANPELEAAIRHVVPDNSKAYAEQEQQKEQWQRIVSTAHPGIFDKSIDPELEASLMTRLGNLGDQVHDPLVVIREITEEKLAHTERMLGKRFLAESAKSAQKAAMSMPGAGASGAKSAPIDADLAEANRIRNMSPADFEKERRRVMGY